MIANAKWFSIWHLHIGYQQGGYMKDISITVVITTNCNMKCKYCINDSGQELVDLVQPQREWKSAEEIILCLENISKVRNIKFIKFFGGEPLLRYSFIKTIITEKKRYSPLENVKFAFTTNAYQKMDDEMISFLSDERVIINISLDGPKELNNAARISKDGKDVYDSVIYNLDRIRKNNYPIALIAVLDERLLNYAMTIRELASFLKKFSPVYKIDPVYMITKDGSKKEIDLEIQKKILALETEFINSVFDDIFSLNESRFIYENNVFRTICNLVCGYERDFVCSAANFMGILPNKRAYACYNLMDSKYLIAEDISKIDTEEMEKKLVEQENLLRLENFPKQYATIKGYGDYCPKENNFASLAYQYRKNMVESVSNNLLKIQAGSPEHLSLIAYVLKGINMDYFDKFD